MWVNFETLPDTSRIWIYPSERKFLLNEEQLIADELMKFTQHWGAHGVPLQASFKILENQFIVIAVNEENAGASGCSIDSSVRVLKYLQHQLGIDFFNRNLVPFLLAGQIQMIPMVDLKQKFTDGIWNGATVTFNTLAVTMGDLRNNWRLSAEKSWVRRYMNDRKVSSVAE